MDGKAERGFSTRAIHGGSVPDANKAVATPIYQTATFRYDTVAEGARLGAQERQKAVRAGAGDEFEPAGVGVWVSRSRSWLRVASSAATWSR